MRCSKCGSNLKCVWKSEGFWEKHYECPKCKSKFVELVGDAMGGGCNHFNKVKEFPPQKDSK